MAFATNVSAEPRPVGAPITIGVVDKPIPLVPATDVKVTSELTIVEPAPICAMLPVPPALSVTDVRPVSTKLARLILPLLLPLLLDVSNVIAAAFTLPASVIPTAVGFANDRLPPVLLTTNVPPTEEALSVRSPFVTFCTNALF